MLGLRAHIACLHPIGMNSLVVTIFADLVGALDVASRNLLFADNAYAIAAFDAFIFISFVFIFLFTLHIYQCSYIDI